MYPCGRYRLAFALLFATAGCARTERPEPEPAVIAGATAEGLDHHLSEAVTRGFSGAFLIAKGGTVVLHGGYGLADRENRVPYSRETVFDVGSITKQFTAAAILRLEETGLLSTADPITSFFPLVPHDKQSITIHHLLTHSSGLIGDFGGDYTVMPRDSLVRLALASRLQWAPGTRFRYSNSGYSLLGAIIEIVSGQAYEQYLYEQLLRPAAMEETGYTRPEWSPARLAVGYRDGRRWGTPLDQRWAPDGPWWNLRANGGILSTLGDLHRWHQALEGDAVLSDESKQKMFAPHVMEDSTGARHYGYGWSISTSARNTRVVAHAGANPYFFADFLRYIEEDVVILMSTNTPDRQATVAPVRRWVIDAVFRERR